MAFDNVYGDGFTDFLIIVLLTFIGCTLIKDYYVESGLNLAMFLYTIVMIALTVFTWKNKKKDGE